MSSDDEAAGDLLKLVTRSSQPYRSRRIRNLFDPESFVFFEAL